MVVGVGCNLKEEGLSIVVPNVDNAPNLGAVVCCHTSLHDLISFLALQRGCNYSWWSLAIAVHDDLLDFKQAQPHKMNVGYKNVNCGIFTLGLLQSLQSSSFLSGVYIKRWRADMQQHAPSNVPGDGVLIIPEESSGKYSLSVIISQLSVQGNFNLWRCLHLSREFSGKTAFLLFS